ncbi:MAG TPA: LacI family DNA-binding transcriptional regulator [Pseudonocardiaceae bacterium]|jgi:LacI family transcriptional regulator|nr:LacI family DNA-binding transcriptional regulator [Pseudonocardiaceae bacterium]
MNDVARVAGVSLKTVSRVVNGEAGVHPSTAHRVLAAIDHLGFRRNLGARNLRRGSTTGTIGLVVEDISNPFYSALNRAVEQVARDSGRYVLTASSGQDPDAERELVLEFCSRRVDGLIVVPAGAAHGYLLPEVRAGTPVVFVDRPPGDIAADLVLVDNAGGMRQAVRHLADYGHRRIAFLGDAPTIFTAVQRLHGFRDGCVAAGIGYDEELVVLGPADAGRVDTALRRLLSGPSPVTAVITGNNLITVHALRALNALAAGSRRPALIGFDDIDLADLLTPPVSVIAQDAAALGRTAAELLLARLGGDDSPPHRVTLPVRLVARGSAEVRP